MRFQQQCRFVQTGGDSALFCHYRRSAAPALNTKRFHRQVALSEVATQQEGHQFLSRLAILGVVDCEASASEQRSMEPLRAR
jgi:hypothetical protein